MGRKGDEPAMQIVGGMFATNISTMPVRIAHAELRYGLFGTKKISSGMIAVSRRASENYYGSYEIPPGETRDVSFDFWLHPPVAAPIAPFTPHSIVFIDQFGNRKKLKRIRFEPTASKAPPAPKEPEEFPYEIANPIEKEVVSVLKAEIARYQMCDRTVGGLGSVHIIYGGHAFTGMGGDSWTPNSPTNQLIVSDPEAATLKSDNMESLVGFYKKLASDEERAQFVNSLLDRLDGKKGYLSVSYFIVVVLWRIGSLAAALQKSRRDLPVGEHKVFGLSNTLMLLNGVLKYRYPDLTNQDLDDIERMIHGLNEHSFLIPAKLAAVRASRLNVISIRVILPMQCVSRFTRDMKHSFFLLRSNRESKRGSESKQEVRLAYKIRDPLGLSETGQAAMDQALFLSMHLRIPVAQDSHRLRERRS